MERLPPRQQGDLGELSAMEWLGSRGYSVFVPVGHSPHVDLIADDGERLWRVQVKTSTVYRNGRWDVTICTRGGNRSWNGLVKRFDPRRCDVLFVVVGDGRRWRVPSGAVDGTAGLRLGGPKYAPFEVEQGHPLRVSDRGAVAMLDGPRRGSRAVKGTRL